MSAKRTAPIALLLLLALGPGCHRQKEMQRGQPQYDVVQEGQTSGASSTTNAPGEMPPPVSMTTAADTTTSFTLSPSQTTTTPTIPPTSQMTKPPGAGAVSPH